MNSSQINGREISSGRVLMALMTACVFGVSVAWGDPCGMVPPIDIAGPTPIQRIGLQKTYVFYQDGIETFVIRPGYRGRVDNFGMLIPFPTPPAIRKVSDDLFAHVAAAVDPPEVVVDLRPRLLAARAAVPTSKAKSEGLTYSDAVKVLRQEAIGMYEVAVLEAGSAAALKRWMTDHGYRYPEGMDKACEDYVKSNWCFVAVKTRVGQKAGVDPRPGLRKVNPKLPDGSTFDGSVQGMGFRFRTDRLVVPMRLSAFNAGETRNVVYVLTEEPMRINNIPSDYVVRQIAGDELYRNLTAPLPLRVIGGTFEDIPEARRNRLKVERDPAPRNGLAGELFAGDLLAAKIKRLAHEFEEAEKELLRISERLELRGAEIDKLHADALESLRKQTLKSALEGVKNMTLTVIDGDFSREVLGRENLTFAKYEMPADKNVPTHYDAKNFGPARERGGKIYKAGAISGAVGNLGFGFGVIAVVILGVVLMAFVVVNERRARLSRVPATRNRKPYGKTSCLLLIVAVLASSATPLRAAEDKLVAQLIEDLNKPEKATRVVKILVSLGDRALTPLFAEAVEGSVLPRRGWAIVCLAEIGGPQVAEWLTRLQGDERQPPLVRNWAAAGRVQMAKSVAAVAELADSMGQFPALQRPIGKRIIALMQSDTNARAIDLLKLSLTPSLRPALSPAVLQVPPKELVEIMTTATDAQIRRLAAGYLATLGATKNAAVSRETRAVYKFNIEALRVPWHGGALFIPAINWSTSDARELVGQLMRWMVFCDRRQLSGELRQLHNNLRSVSLARAAGYRSPGFRQVGVEEWLLVWGRAVGREAVQKILAEQGVAGQEKYKKVLDALPAQQTRDE